MTCAGKVYWTGSLFDIKALIGNRMLADAFGRQAAGRLGFASMTGALAVQVVRDLDRCANTPPVASSHEAAFAAFRHAVHPAGGTMPERLPYGRIHAIIEERNVSKRNQGGENKC